MFLDGFAPSGLWRHVPVEDTRARKLFDRHYSRQTVGARGVLAPGLRFLLWHDGPAGGAGWGIVYNVFRRVYRFRNSFFRNESGTLSSSLIIAATSESYAIFARRYHALPTEPLESEIDIAATADRRGRARPPGYCYECAGWTWVRSTIAGHGRSAKAIYRAPPPIEGIA